MADNVLLPTREFCKLILSLKKIQAAFFFKIFVLHSVCLGVSLRQPVTYVTFNLLDLRKRNIKV